ncbi:hypothetical protein [Algibacter pacificus]|uniref:hypothetical protein n=1 Tax=Algibacter pacificus TaxID=2599389 RepID=UPI0011CBA141|nr:hypothetical protein [Algibacter pacificus]
MKLRTNLTLLLLVAITIFSCDEIDKLTEFKVEQDFDTTLNIDTAVTKEAKPQAKSTAEGSWSEEVTIDLKDNDDVSENLDLIEEVAINGLTYEIINYNGPDDVAITNTQIDFGGTVITIEDTNLKTADDNGTLFTIDDAAKLGTIANKLKTDKTMTITASGDVAGETTSVTFGIKLHMETTITIDVI